MADQALRQLSKNNEGYAKNHKASLLFKDFPNMQAVIVLTCMDPRCCPERFWNFGEDGPVVIRNAGGRAADAIRSMRILSAIMSNGKNTLGAVAVVHHTDCGVTQFPKEFIADRIRDRAPAERRHEIDGDEFGLWQDPDASVKEDMAIIKADPFLPKDLAVLGYVYDIESGKTREVV